MGVMGVMGVNYPYFKYCDRRDCHKGLKCM